MAHTFQTRGDIRQNRWSGLCDLSLSTNELWVVFCNLSPRDACVSGQATAFWTGSFESVDPANSTCGLVAGARYEPLQIEMRPIERFVAGLRRVA
jgi:hypothetical protein